MTLEEAGKLRKQQTIWAEQAVRGDVIPILMIGINEGTAAFAIFGIENFPTQNHLIKTLENIISEIRKRD